MTTVIPGVMPRCAFNSQTPCAISARTFAAMACPSIIRAVNFLSGFFGQALCEDSKDMACKQAVQLW